ncbi:MAG: serine protease [Rubripirellula sp.]
MSGRIFLFVGCCTLASHSLAQVKLDRLFPPAVTIGNEAVIKAEGKFPDWPPRIVCDREDVTIECAEKSGELNVAVAKNASPGVAWVRMRDKTSVSQLVCLLITSTSVQTETDKNNKVSEATVVEAPCMIAGRLEKSADIDSYKVSVRDGDTLVVSTTAHQWLGSPMDAVLQLTDERGNVLQQTDDSQGLDPRIVHQVSRDRDLFVRIFAFPETPNSTIGYAGSASFVYAMQFTTGPFLNHALPLVSSPANESKAFGWNLPGNATIQREQPSSDSPAACFVDGVLGWGPQIAAPDGSSFASDTEPEASLETLPGVFSGHLSKPKEIDGVQLNLKKGVRYHATVHSRNFGFPVDSVLKLVQVAAEGKETELASNDDRQREKWDAGLSYTAKADGVVELRISDLVDGHGTTHAYSVVIQESLPVAVLNVAEDRFTVKPAAELELTVTIDRQHGFNQKLQLQAVQLPAGVTSEAVISEPKGGSAKTVKLKLNADKTAKAIQSKFRVVGTVLGDDGKPTDETFNAVTEIRPLVSLQDFWLSVSP